MEIWSATESQEIMHELQSRLTNLSKLSFTDLVALPEFSTDNMRINEIEVSFTTYRDIENDGHVEIVVQARVSKSEGMILKRAQVVADGFRMTPSGERERLAKKVLYSYM